MEYLKDYGHHYLSHAITSNILLYKDSNSVILELNVLEKVFKSYNNNSKMLKYKANIQEQNFDTNYKKSYFLFDTTLYQSV